jgi:hypothetical protein
LLVLLENIRRIQALGDETKYLLPDEALKNFIERAIAKLGKKSLGNPREVVRAFVCVLQEMEDNPGKDWHQVFDEEIDARSQSANDAERHLAEFDIKAQ